MGCGILHKDKDSGAVEPILPESFAGRGKLACLKAFQAEEDAVYCTCGSGDNCAGYINSRCCNCDLSMSAVAAKDSNILCERTAEVITDLSERRKPNPISERLPPNN